VITVEDPVEYHVAGVNQIQTHAKVGLDFATGMRAILRHDPDVVMIGEIRDKEDGPDGGSGVADRPPGAEHAPHK